MTVDYVVNKLLKNIKLAFALEGIEKPYSWALYETWKEMDQKEGSKAVYSEIEVDKQ